MKEVIDKIKELFTVLQDAIASTRKKAEENSKKEESLEGFKAFQNDRKEDLDKREVGIKKVEDVVALKESAKVMMDDVKSAFRKLEVREETLKDAQAKNIEQLRDVNEQKNSIKKQNDDLTTARKALDKEKEEYKTKVIEELQTKI